MSAAADRTLLWHPRGRVQRLRASHSYRSVLLLILATVVFVMAAPNETWSASVVVMLLSAMLIVAFWTSGLGWHPPRTLVLVGIGVAAAILAPTVSSNNTLGAVWLVALVFVLATMGVLVLGVIDQGEVTVQSVTAAICFYLLLGLLFAFAYGAAAAIGSGYFFAQGTDGTPSIRLYFSYITMATVGYGDYSPAGNLGRTLAMLEALLGQLFLVTVLALLVSQLGLKARKGRE